MAEITYVAEHPNGCVACQAVSGPFVVVSLAGWTVNTVNGPFQVDTDIVLCAKKDGREGCAGQIARTAGYISEDEHENVVRQYESALAQNGAMQLRVTELEEHSKLDRRALAKEVAQEILNEAG